MSVKLLTEHDLEFLNLTGRCSGSYESTLVKLPHCWKSHVAAHFLSIFDLTLMAEILKQDLRLLLPWQIPYNCFVDELFVLMLSVNLNDVCSHVGNQY